MSILDFCIGIIAPPECIGCGAEGANICQHCINSNLQAFGERCAGCNRLSIGNKTCSTCRATGLPNHIWVSFVYDGLVAELIKQYKFGHQRSVAKQIAGLMAESVSNNLKLKDNWLVPLPTATTRIRERGFDHSILLARELSRGLGFSTRQVLGRLGQTSQIGLKRTDRLAQSSEQYYVRTALKVKNKKIILVDDVMTTGATLRSAASALRKAGASSVDALVFAKKV